MITWWWKFSSFCRQPIVESNVPFLCHWIFQIQSFNISLYIQIASFRLFFQQIFNETRMEKDASRIFRGISESSPAFPSLNGSNSFEGVIKRIISVERHWMKGWKVNSWRTSDGSFFFFFFQPWHEENTTHRVALPPPPGGKTKRRGNAVREFRQNEGATVGETGGFETNWGDIDLTSCGEGGGCWVLERESRPRLCSRGWMKRGRLGCCTRLPRSHCHSWQKVIGIPYILGNSSPSLCARIRGDDFLKKKLKF